MSTQMAGVIAATDAQNSNCPVESPSNNPIQIDSMVDSSRQEVLLDLQGANFLNANGITTALNFMGGFVLWGNYTACYTMLCTNSAIIK
ncbi:MAG: hypothetical protein FWH05_08710 [Oscillospiraceae bacterium]|nr:hypothetical protein [Oscillospiraceae bacterium]